MTTPQDNAEPSVASLGSKPLTFGSLFAGIGGFDLGLERAGMRCEWQVEIDPYARAVLAKHWPDVRRHEDVRTFPPPKGEWGVDVICGGFPCQDISGAGKKRGLAGERSGLWREFARIIGELRPRFVIVENVSAVLIRGMGTVLGDLASLGYDAEWHCIPAAAVGAPQFRDRVWIVAHPCGRRLSRRAQRDGQGQIIERRDDIDRLALGQRRARDGKSWLRRADDGIPHRVDRLMCLGNAVVPQVVEFIGRAIVEAA
jgi:DNA (cytosine-5)-methyltransferase 1